MKHLLLVDGNSLAWACYHAQELSHDGVKTGVMFQFLTSLRWRLDNQLKNHLPIVLWDGNPQWRKDIYPEYKAKRTDTAEKLAERAAFSEQKTDLQSALAMLGITQLTNPHAEADDLARLFVDEFSFDPALQCPTQSIVLMTADRDWVQLVAPGITVDEHRTKETTGVWNFKERTGFDNTRQFVEYKALTGDVSDNIKGAGGIGDKGARELISTYGGVSEFLEAAAATPPPKFGAALKRLANNEPYKGSSIGVRDAFERNMKLVNMREFPIDVLKSNIECHQRWDLSVANHGIAAFFELCQRNGFNSILREFDAWVQPFIKAYTA